MPRRHGLNVSVNLRRPSAPWVATESSHPKPETRAGWTRGQPPEISGLTFARSRSLRTFASPDVAGSDCARLARNNGVRQARAG